MIEEENYPADTLIPLQRGKACIACRRRKTKCDGVRPVCSQCVARGVTIDCEYTDKQGRTRIQALEENVVQLQARLRELENPNQPGDSMLLSNPYQQQGASAVSESGDHPVSLDWPSLQMFFRSAHSIGFVLDAERIQSSLGSNGTQHAPFVSLLNSINLFTYRITNDITMRDTEEDLLDTTVACLENAITDTLFPQDILDIIQGKLLLAQYFMTVGRSLEGFYHLNGATSLATSCRLQQSIFSTPELVPLTSSGSNPTPTSLLGLLPSLDSGRDAVRASLFWTLYAIDYAWSTTQRILSSAHFEDRPILGNQANISWQNEMPRTHYMSSDRTTYASVFELRAKACVLYNHSAQIQSSSQPSVKEEIRNLELSVTQLNNVVDAVYSNTTSLDDKAHLLVTKSFIHISMLGIYKLKSILSPEDSVTNRVRIIGHAREVGRVMSILAEWRKTNTVFCDPILAYHSFYATEAMLSEISRLQSENPSAESQVQQDRLSSEIRNIISHLRECSGPRMNFPIFDQRAEEIEDSLYGATT